MKIKLPPIKLYKRHPNNRYLGYTDTYGALKLLEDYCGKPMPLTRQIDWFYWTHGCHGPWRMRHPGLLTANLKNKMFKYLVESKEQEAYLKKHGYKHVYAVGLPILYVKDIKVERLPRSLLIMPSHTIRGNEKLNQDAYDNYINYIKPYLDNFDLVKACVHQGCIDNNMWIEEFKALGIDIIVGADPEDQNALLRQKHLYHQFDYVTTNAWGSHVAYALYFGCKVSIDGPHQELPKSEFVKQKGWDENPELVDILFSAALENDRQKTLQGLYTAPHLAKKNIPLGQKLVGDDCKKSPKQLYSIIKPKPNRVWLYYSQEAVIRIKNKFMTLCLGVYNLLR